MKFWYEAIPVNLNNNGDPLIENQAESTVEKVLSLEGLENRFHICTKAVPDEKTFSMLERITERQKRNLFLSYSLTGLNEGGYSFEERIDAISRLNETLGDVTILLRPLIAGRNDGKENIEHIVRTAHSCGGRIIIGGLHDSKLMKACLKTEAFFNDCCASYGVKRFGKTSCAVADMSEQPCRVHGVAGNAPKNLDVLDVFGYRYELEDGKVVLAQASSGDLNFIRFITESMPYARKIISRLNRLTTLGRRNYEVTSGWMSWSDNKPCNIGCDYCVMNQIGYLHSREEVGCHPSELENLRVDISDRQAVDLPEKALYSYTDLRRQTECVAYA